MSVYKKTIFFLFFSLMAAAFCALLLLFPTKALAAETGERILFPQDYRDFYRFGEEGATASPKYLFAGGDYLVFADDDVLTVKKADGTVTAVDISALSHEYPLHFAQYAKDSALYLLLWDKTAVYSLNLNVADPVPVPLLQDTVVGMATGFTAQGDSLYLKGTSVIRYTLTSGEEGLTATNATTDFNLPINYWGSSLFALTKEGSAVIPSNDQTKLLAGGNEFPLSAKPISLVLSGETAYYLGVGQGDSRAVYQMDLTTGTEKLLVGLTNNSAVGVAVSSNTLYVAYANPETTQKQYIARYLLTAEGVTLAGEICAYSARDDRLSASASAIAEYNGSVYVADGENNRISCFDGASYTTLPLEFAPTFLSVSENHLITGAGNRVVLLKKDGTLEREITLDEGESVKKATYASNGRFYLLLEETVQGNPYFSVSEFRLQEMAFTKDFIPADKSENVLAIATDLSNHLYLLKTAATGASVAIYDAEGKALSTVTGDFQSAYDLQVDFENNLYFLLSDNRIGVMKEGEAQISTLYNLLTDYPYLKNEQPTAFFLSFLQKPCYVLYSGFVMKTENVVLSSPVEIKIPTDVDITAPHSGARYVEAESGAVLFHFDLETYFTTQAYALGYERILEPTTFIYLGDTGAYAYVLSGKDAGFIRKEYLTEVSPEADHTPLTGTPVTTVACNLYRYPLLHPVYQVKDGNAATLSLLKNTALTITKEVTHRGVDFYALSYADSTVYIPKGLVTYTAAAPTTEKYTLRTVQKVYGETPVLFADKECTQKICNLKDEARIRVYEVKDGVATVVFVSEQEGETIQTHGYVQSKFLVNRGSNAGIVSLVILLLVLSLVLSTAFILKRKANLPPPEEDF